MVYLIRRDFNYRVVLTGLNLYADLGFNAFAVQLNSLPAELQNILPPTDSRLREDLQAVERGEYSKAFTSPPELTLLDKLRQGVPCLFISVSAFAAKRLQAI